MAKPDAPETPAAASPPGVAMDWRMYQPLVLIFALGVLITAYLKARGRGGFVRLADPQDHLKDVLRTTRLDHLFEVFPDVRCAAAKP